MVNQIREIVHRVAPAAQAILYGSEARGDAREDSDIDLLVLLDNDKPTYDEENEVRWPLYELEIKTKRSDSSAAALAVGMTLFQV